jgi:hypothetical protein
MRDSYYQSSENPVQKERLPVTRPTLQFLAPGMPRSELLATVATAVAAMGLATVLTLALYQPGGISWFEPWDSIFCWPVLVGSLMAAVWRRQIAPLCHPVCLAAIVVACISQTTPELLQIALLSAFTALLIYAFGQHWTVLSTTSPMPIQAANVVRSRCRRQLVCVAVVLAAVVAALLATGSTVCRIALLTLPLAALTIPAPRQLPTNRYRIIYRALLSWITQESKRLPGLVQSPAGPIHARVALLVVACILTSIALTQSGVPVSFAGVYPDYIPAHEQESSKLGYLLLMLFASAAYVVGTPGLVALGLVGSATMPVLLDAAAEHANSLSEAGTTEPIATDLRNSPDRIERSSIFHGRVVADGSPALIHRDAYMEHAHGLGDSGGGKTSLFLCPIIEQLGSFADSSFIVLDPKADTLELLASLQAVSELVGRQTGRPLPLKFFSNQRTHRSYAFNPMRQPFWRDLDLLTQTDILCAANGLTYGTDYGAGYYSSANAAILLHTLKTYPHVATFGELADCIGTVMTAAKKRDLHPEIRKAGVHVQEVIKRLAACEALNVTKNSGHPSSVVEQSIDLTDLFREPQLLYCHLPATLSPSAAPEIARLFTYMLLAASTQTERRCRVYLVIDEFQRIVANNFEYMLQLARSMGVGVIIANQTMQDLRKGNVDLIPAIEANCRVRQWFSVSSADDQERLIKSSGLTVETLTSRSSSVDSQGRTSNSVTSSEHIAPRLTINDVLLTNDHPFRSILRVSRGAGYAQFGGMPVIIESQYHISKEEYQRRKALPWPTADGAFLPTVSSAAATGASSQKTSTQPSFQWSEEVIGEKKATPLAPADERELNTLFDNLRDDLEQKPGRKRKKGDKS